MKQALPTTLMTGATGFLGQFTLRELLRQPRRVVALLRGPVQESRPRLAGLMRPLGVEIDDHLRSGRLLLREGALPDCLPAPDWGRTDDILACAASLQLFSNGNGEPHRTNVDGTTVLLDWATRHGVERLHAVSTAYVCGSMTGTIREAFHPRPSGFQTEYEETKWVAEQRLVKWAEPNGRVLTVLRPSFIIGDSTTGYTTQFGGFYQFGRMMSVLKKEYGAGSNGDGTYIPLRIPGRGADPLQNFVPVDYAARMIAGIMSDPGLHGRIYHLIDPASPTLEVFKGYVEEYFHVHGGYFVDCCELPPDRTEAESLMWEKYDLLMPRMNHTPRFDESNTRAVRERMGLDYPHLTRQRVFKLLDYAVSQRWGQRANRRHTRTGN